MAIERNKETQKRYLHRDEAGVKPLTDAQIAALNEKFDLTKDLGIPLDSEGNPDTFGKYVDEHRVFFTNPRPDMSDGARSAKEVGIKIGSKEFWRQVQLGNVFVYPAGQKGPSQLLVSDPGKGEPAVSLSKEIRGALHMPQREIKAPGFFKRVFSFLNPKWREQVKSYDNQNYTNCQLVVESHCTKRDDNVLKRETDWVKNAEKKKMQEAWLKEHSANLNKVNNINSNRAVCDETVDRIFGSKPDIKKEWIIKPELDPKTKEPVMDPDTGKPKMTQGHATEDAFNTLEKYDLDMSKISSSLLKKPFTEQDYVTTAFFTTTEEQILKNSESQRQGAAPGIREVLESTGISKEDADYLANEEGSNNAFTDYYQLVRGATGTRTIPHVIQPAREKTKEAFEAYGRGDKTKLAYLIANGVKRAAFEHCRLGAAPGAKDLGDASDSGIVLQTARLSELIKKDPDLERIAKKQYGMKDEDLKVVHGVAEYHKLDEARNAAKEKLARAEKYQEPLDEDVKKKCIKDIVKADLACQMITTEKDGLTSAKGNEKVQDICTKVMATGYMPKIIGHKGPNNEYSVREPMPKGKMLISSAQSYAMFTVPALLNKRPEFVSNLKADSRMLDEAAETVMTQDKLYQPEMSEQQAFEKMDSHIYSAEGMKKASEIMKKMSDPQAEKVVDQPTMSINDRRKMFEVKQTGGPTA